MNLSSILSLIGNFVGFGSLIVAVLVMRNGAGQAVRRAEETARNFKREIDLSLQQFATTLDDKLDQRFRMYVDRDLLDLRVQLLESNLSKEVQRLDATQIQMDHRVSRDANQIGMLMDVMLKAGMHNNAKPA